MLPKRLLLLEEKVLATDQTVWQAAMRELAEVRHGNALTLLHTSMSDLCEDRSACARACFELAVCQHSDVALRHSSYEIRESSLLVAGRCREVRAIDEVSRILRNESTVAIRQLAAQVLGEINQEACVEALQQARSDRSQQVRVSALEALKTLKYSSAERAIAGFLDDVNWSTREIAFEHLSNTGWIPRSNRQRVQRAVMLGRFDEAVRYGEESVQPLIGSALCLGNSEVRDWAAANLAKIRTPRVIAGLRAGLKSPHPEVRRAAEEALQAVEPLPPVIAAGAPAPPVPQPVPQKPTCPEHARPFEAACSLLADALEL